MKAVVLKEIRDKIENGYHAELLYSYRSGHYEITIWKNDIHMDFKTYKIPRGMYDPNELKEIVYGRKFA